MARQPKNVRYGFFPDGLDQSALQGVLPASEARRKFLISAGYGAACLFLGTRQRVQAIDRPVSLINNEVAGPSVSLGLPPPTTAGEPVDKRLFDMVIVGGRVIDPETGLDQTANVGIEEGKIAAITTVPIQGKSMMVADGKIVAPGFIDLLSYEPNPFGVRLKILDGVTTNLAMHGVSNYATEFFKAYEGQTAVNFGAAFHQHFMRGDAIAARPDKPLTPEQLDRLEKQTLFGLKQGFAGVSFSPEYSPGTTDEEIDRLARVAADVGHVCFFHVRDSGVAPKNMPLMAIQSAVRVADRFGVAVHIEHITSTGGTSQMDEALGIIESARANGADVTACFYPYDYWGTFLASSRFSEGWQERFNLRYEDLQIAGTDQRLSESTFVPAQRKNLLVAAIGSIPSADIRVAFDRPWTIVSSDAITTPSLNNHPRGAGTFARTLGIYVRDLKAIDLVSALAKMTILPAKRVESMIPEMSQKGRLQPGCDADIVVFDPKTIKDAATIRHPGAPSVGVRTVLVGGIEVVKNGEIVEGVTPGKALRSSS